MSRWLVVCLSTLALTGAAQAATPPWLTRAFKCIYRYENGGHGWTANTGNGYYGGLQMDLDFQRDWGKEFLRAWGTADNWPPRIQIKVAVRAWRILGFSPWPTTSRLCGLR